MTDPANDLQGAGEGANAASLRAPGGKFTKGHSGNPAGKAKGTRNRNTVLAQAFATEHGKILLDIAYARAHEDNAVLLFLLSRAFPKVWHS